ncbi:cryptochrome/photolyase family protein [Ramlibacter sp. PS4R-6]|uniref:cryptochrome/photolyase family protein n=1 Tax=Ramlibacter sp. PS4R-6 TaxID=3133438 RepID=UPI0030A26048
MWFRRDLRAHDHAALYEALRACERVHAVFVFDPAILGGLPRRDRRVEFVRESVAELRRLLPGLVVRHARAADEIPRLAGELGVQAVFANRDYEAAAIARDDAVRTALARDRIAFHAFKDQAVFDGDEVLTQAGKPYTVFTPYKNAWLAKLDDFQLRSYAVDKHAHRLVPTPQAEPVPSLADLGFEATNLRELDLPTGVSGGAAMFRDFLAHIDAYGATRDFPALHGTSGLGVHLRFGTVSVRELAREAHRRMRAGSEGAGVWLSELVWRDFFFQVLAHFPHVVDGAFRREYDAIEWESGAHADERFAAWCEGRTGYPIVDAAMAQINATGFMHNRLRMVAASFLVKDLGIDWRRGERYFAEKLNDYDLAANNGNWQWAASTGCDAQPWFRIFNPESQQAKFDPEGSFVGYWLAGRKAVPPIVAHGEARERALRRYAAVRP